jgi:hypothetical protein
MKIVDDIIIRSLDGDNDIEIAIVYKEQIILAIWIDDINDDNDIIEYILHRWRYFNNDEPLDIEVVSTNIDHNVYAHCKIVGVDEV